MHLFSLILQQTLNSKDFHGCGEMVFLSDLRRLRGLCHRQYIGGCALA